MELLVVMVVTSITVAVSIPTYVGFRQKSIEEGEALKMVALMRDAVSRAKTGEQGSNWALNVDVSSGYYEILKDGSVSLFRTYLDPAVSFTATSTSRTVPLASGPNIQIATSTIDVTLTTQGGRFTDRIVMDIYGVVNRTSNY